MRIPLATNLKTRTGAPSTKDARQVNSYMEVKGDQAAVRKRPAAQGGISIGTGTAQGGIGFNIGGTPYFIGFWGDMMQTYTGSGTSWSSGSFYLQGDHVSVNFQDFWALNDNTGNNPTSSPTHWSVTYFYPKKRYTITGSTNTVSYGRSTVTAGGFNTTTGIYTTRDALNNIIDSGTGTLVTPQNIVIGSQLVYSNYITPASEAATNATNSPTNFVYAPGYSYYIANGTLTATGSSPAYTGQVIYSPY